jgi:hypothetical protein
MAHSAKIVMTAHASARVTRLSTVAAYVVLGAALVWSRLAELGHSFWTDEILMVSQYVRKGPHQILAGPTLNHELYALLAWATKAVVGESEIAFRLWSVLPFIAGVVIVTWWLHARLGALSGLLFLFLATVSPELLDITRQARGYGIAFLAMSVVVVSALEAARSRRTDMVVAFCVAGVVGTWTLPQAGIAFLATGSALLAVRELRRPVAVGLILAAAAIIAWYAPHLGAVRSSSQIEDGVKIGFPWVLTAPIDQILLPALLWIDGTVIVAGVVWLPLVLLAAIVAASSPLLRSRISAWILCAGILATVVVLWIGQAYIIPRYLSYLLVPLFVLMATGAASILARAAKRDAVLRTVACLIVLGALAFRFVLLAPDVVGLPREANRDAAEVVLSREPPTPALVYARNPQNVGFYLNRPFVDLRQRDVRRIVCGQPAPVFYVVQPFALAAVDVPCLDRPGVQDSHLRQYARGGETDVWLVPPSS